METTFIYELIGYIASVLVAISLMMSKIVQLRIVNMIGAATFALYGVLIGSIPVAGMNAFIVLINIYYLTKIYTADEYFKLLKVAPESDYLNAFIDFYKKQMLTFQPHFSPEKSKNQLNIFVLRDMVPAGLLMGNVDREGVLSVDLDFVLPQYRDFKIGSFLFNEKVDFFRAEGIKKIVAIPGSDQHNTYLREMGFVREGSAYILTL